MGKILLNSTNDVSFTHYFFIREIFLYIFDANVEILTTNSDFYKFRFNKFRYSTKFFALTKHAWIVEVIFTICIYILDKFMH